MGTDNSWETRILTLVSRCRQILTYSVKSIQVDLRKEGVKIIPSEALRISRSPSLANKVKKAYRLKKPTSSQQRTSRPAQKKYLNRLLLEHATNVRHTIDASLFLLSQPEIPTRSKKSRSSKVDLTDKELAQKRGSSRRPLEQGQRTQKTASPRELPDLRTVIEQAYLSTKPGKVEAQAARVKTRVLRSSTVKVPAASSRKRSTDRGSNTVKVPAASSRKWSTDRGGILSQSLTKKTRRSVTDTRVPAGKQRQSESESTERKTRSEQSEKSAPQRLEKMKRSTPSDGHAPLNGTETQAGSNWKALKRSLGSEASNSVSKKSETSRPQTRNRVTRTEATASASKGTVDSAPKRTAASASKGTADSAVGRKAPTILPWFAEDISQQDLELVRQSTPDDKVSRLLQWEGIDDPVSRKKAILGGVPETAPEARKEAGNYLAIDCEMVGVGYKGSESVLARVSIVNFYGATLMDRFVKPQEKVTDYRTWVSGVRAKDLATASTFSQVQADVAKLIKGKTLVGHAIQNDLRALLLSHPRPLIRDTATFKPLQELAKTKYPSLKKLAKLILDIDIQVDGESHSSVEDARATMAVFRSQKTIWDESLRSRHGNAPARQSKAGSSQAGTVSERIWKAPIVGPTSGTAVQSTARSASTLATAGPPQARLKPKIAAQTDWWKDTA